MHKKMTTDDFTESELLLLELVNDEMSGRLIDKQTNS